MGFPPPSAFPPSMGTTGPVIVAGAGLVSGTPWGRTSWGRPLAPAGLPPAVASTAPAAAPATASRLTTTGTRCQASRTAGGRRMRRVAKDGVRRPRASTSCPNICPETGRRPRAARRATALSSSGVVTGAWQVNWRQTYAAGAPLTSPRPASSGTAASEPAAPESAGTVPSPRARTAPGGAACSAVWCSARVRSSSALPTTAISAGPASRPRPPPGPRRPRAGTGPRCRAARRGRPRRPPGAGRSRSARSSCSSAPATANVPDGVALSAGSAGRKISGSSSAPCRRTRPARRRRHRARSRAAGRPASSSAPRPVTPDRVRRPSATQA